MDNQKEFMEQFEKNKKNDNIKIYSLPKLSNEHRHYF
jgi:hypothetical protein